VIVQHGYGLPERVLQQQEVDRPSVGDDDVLIRVRATSVNTADRITVTGVPQVLRRKSGLRQPATRVRGSDAAGIITAAGRNVTDLRAGDEGARDPGADRMERDGYDRRREHRARG
jgi:NADPH:quinone reductase-like Zn-dependent oxidoreductase